MNFCDEGRSNQKSTQISHAGTIAINMKDKHDGFFEISKQSNGFLKI